MAAAVSVAVSGTAAVGVAAAGAVAHNTIEGVIEASVVGSDVLAGGDIGVVAQDSSAIQAMLFSAAVSVAASGGVSVGVSLSVTEATNVIDGSTLATIDDSTVDSTAGGVSVEALSDDSIQAFALSAAVAVGGASGVSVKVAAAGVFAFNTLTGSVEASIKGGDAVGGRSEVNAADDIEVSAQDESRILAMLGAAAIAAGGAGGVSVNVSVAATYAENIIGGSAIATIDDATVNSTGGAVTVDALADDTIEAFGLAVGISAGGAGGVSINVALSAVAATNLIGNAVEASIEEDSVVTANDTTNGAVTVEATDLSDIFAVLLSASVAAGGAGAVSVNVAAAFVYASNALTASTDFDWNDDGVKDAKDLHDGVAILNRLNELRAGEDGIYEDMVVDGGDGVVGSGGADDDTSTADDNRTAVEAINDYILANPGATYLTALGSITSFDINGDGSIDYRDLLLTSDASDDEGVGSVVLATIDASTVDTEGAVTVSASNYDAVTDDSASITAIGIAVGIAAGGAGGVSVNVSGAGVIAFNEVSSDIEASIVGDSTVTADGDVTVVAVDQAEIDSILLAISVSAGGAAGVSVNVAASLTYGSNSMGGSLLATIDDSVVATTGGEITVDAYADNQVQAIGVAVGVAAGGAAGASINVSMAGVVALHFNPTPRRTNRF